jgi:hypothetical protein
MAIPRKGSKKIEVNDMTFRWKVSEGDPVILDKLWMTANLSISPEIRFGSTLTLEIRKPGQVIFELEKSIQISRSTIQITPKIVAACIQYALQIGWQPMVSGKPKFVPFSEIETTLQMLEEES